jgi:hypothetical protein
VDSCHLNRTFSSISDKSWLLLCLCLLPIYIIFLAFYCDKICAYHINLIEINETYVHIIYKKRNELIEIIDLIEGFAFKKFQFSYRQTPYLRIKHQNNLTLRQYLKWDWKVESFDEAIGYLTKRKILNEGFSIS